MKFREFRTAPGGGRLVFGPPCSGVLGAWKLPPPPSTSRRTPGPAGLTATAPSTAAGGRPSPLRARTSPAAVRQHRARVPAVVLWFLQPTPASSATRAGSVPRPAPAAIRSALGPLAFHLDRDVFDAGDVVVEDDSLEAGQERAGRAIIGTARRRQPHRGAGRRPRDRVRQLPWRGRVRGGPRGKRLGVLNLDAHFDLRDEPDAELRHAVPADGPRGSCRGRGTAVRRRRDFRAEQHPNAVRDGRPDWA